MAERIGILGGTFDPPHIGHLLAAYAAMELLPLDRVILVPAAQQPLKVGRESAPAADRLAMVRALAEADPRLSVDTLELDREGLSFTIDSLREFRSRFPDAALFLLLGEDTARTLPQWRDPAGIAAIAEIVVVTRGEGMPAETGDIPVRRIPSRRVDCSATELRARVRAGLPIRGFVPDAVAELIASRGLYRQSNE